MAWDGRGKTNDSERNASAKICAAFIGFFRVVKNDHTGRGRPRKGTDILCKKYERSLNLINPANMGGLGGSDRRRVGGDTRCRGFRSGGEGHLIGAAGTLRRCVDGGQAVASCAWGPRGLIDAVREAGGG